MLSKHIFSNICLIVASLIWGTAFVAQTTGMDHIGPLTFTNIRFLIGGLIVFPLAIKEIPRFKKLLKKKKLFIIIFFYWTKFIVGHFFATIRSAIYKDWQCSFFNNFVCSFCSNYFSIYIKKENSLEYLVISFYMLDWLILFNS